RRGTSKDLLCCEMALSFHGVLVLVGLCAPVFGVPPASAPCRGSPGPSSTKSAPASQASPCHTDFAFRLYRRLAAEAPHQNVFLSPTSVSTALAMLSLGARSATKTQILQSLGFNLTRTPESAIHEGFQRLVRSLAVPSKDLALRMGSVLFVQKGLPLQARFLDHVEKLYASEVLPTDFSNPALAQQKINSYVEKETKGKVVDLIQGLDPLTAMVLVNHIFFKAKWEKPFSPADTRKSFPFLAGGRAAVRVPMMHQEEQLAFGVDPGLNCSVLRMDYQGDAAAFFVLPSEGKMGQLEQALSAGTLRRWRRSLQQRWLHVFLPRFSMSASYGLETVLPKMGVHDAFGKNADFSGITTRGLLQLSKATYKAVLDVSEVGTEAVAASAAKLAARSKDGPPSPAVFFNRPFLLIIISEATGCILFLGKVENPTKS
ncbi:serpin A9, partial [Carlito syrichta]|uniref:Serpin A9 n=1 Tax=Carlito syrichta TaxID=1868482 RepID=A0A1U7SSP5_CARSF